MKVNTKLVLSLVSVTWLLACQGEGCQKKEQRSEQSLREPLKPEPQAKTNEPLQPLPTQEEVMAKLDMDKILLGRALYHDKTLSGDETLACVTCHGFDHGGAEPRKVSTGIKRQQGPINAPTVLNSSLNFRQFWDGRAADLKEQALGPVTNPVEMGGNWDDVLPNLKKSEAYQKAFAKHYHGEFTMENVADAIAEYEKSLITPSRFDDYLRGNEEALSQAEKDGYQKFKETGCIACHVGQGVGGTMYQKMGLVKDYFEARGGKLTDADMGRYNVTKNEADKHFFKVPLLRNVELTKPYFHDGSVETLEEAVTLMARHQLGKELSKEDVASIVAFLNSLTGKLPEHTIPPQSEE